MPLSPSHSSERRPSGYSWHQDDTVDAQQILLAALNGWDSMPDDHRTDARRIFYAGLFKCCADYLVHRMTGTDDDSAAEAARKRLMFEMIKDDM